MAAATEFNPDRLDLARRRRGMTKRALADSVGISQRSLVNYSYSIRAPSDEVVDKFSGVLGFPVEFFHGPTLEEPPESGASFRALTNVTARLRDQAIAGATLGLSLSDWIEERFNLPDVDIPRFERVEPEDAAMEVRNRWGLGERPIRNVIDLLEFHGVRVFPLSEDARVIDAYSFWRGNAPYVFLNTTKSAERSRMDAAHELGHLILHWKSGSQKNRQAEQEAQQFGAAFLMPRSSILAYAPRGASLISLIEAKGYWIVSLANLTYRMHKVGLLTNYQYRRLFAEIGKRNYRSKEPDPAPRETSQILNEVFRQLWEQGVTVSHVARQLSLHAAELSCLLYGLVTSTPLVVAGSPD